MTTSARFARTVFFHIELTQTLYQQPTVVVEGFAKNRTCIIVDNTKNKRLSREEIRLAMGKENNETRPL
jgi:hypothetical protein